ncbi:hypothetical protein [Lederbergia citrea]|uniref:hypothetical protein n=1 Tax=Lederbergia citrea TaxID=2833581 RepID=UPI001BC9111E|nr:hypothetical protein [Lederbergia citrea]MBS4178167.1 hypothetical protein [Lederbergia citrea]
MEYNRELRKIKTLLIIGIILAVILTIFTFVKYGSFNPLEFDSLITLLVVTLYPLGLTYGWREMFGFVGFVDPGTPADRYYTKKERIAYQENNLLAFGLRIGVVICFGWIIGVWNAYKTLRYLKKYS